jgi:ribose 5-phosphate isomerase B
MRIAIAADHNGAALKAHLSRWLADQGHDVDDRGADPAGTGGTGTVDYPLLCADVGRRVVGGDADRGIVIGGTGAGETIACNKIPGVRAGLCHELFTTEISRAHNDSNVMVLGAMIVGPRLAQKLTQTWLATPFAGGRHQQRLDQIAQIERASRQWFATALKP